MRMKINCFLRPFCLLGLFLLSFTPVLAQDSIRIEISGVGARQIPIVITGFTGETSSKQKISAIIKADLERSGLFKIVDTPEVLSENASINYSNKYSCDLF